MNFRSPAELSAYHQETSAGDWGTILGRRLHSAIPEIVTTPVVMKTRLAGSGVADKGGL